MKVKVINGVFLLSLILTVSACQVEKTYYRTGQVQSKTRKHGNIELVKNYTRAGKLESKIKTVMGTYTYGQKTESALYSTKIVYAPKGFRKKQKTRFDIRSTWGFYYQTVYKEYNKKRKLILTLQYMNNAGVEGTVYTYKVGRTSELKPFLSDTSEVYLNKLVTFGN